MMSFDTQVIGIQPTSTSFGFAPVDGINVRILRDTPQDAEFAARLVVEAFRGKIVHNITERKLPIAVRNLTVNHMGQAPAFYNRTFVAEISGRPVGLLQLKFKGDTEIERDDYLTELGCWHLCRFACFGMATTEKVGKSTECYLDHICVDESARGKGVGKALMQRAEQEARARNCSVIYLYVLTTNRAIHLYERQGYRITQTQSCCISFCVGPPGSIYKMEKSLHL